MIACLRMLLAYRGIHVGEADLLKHASLEEGGLDPDQSAQVAKRFDVSAEARQADFETITTLVEARLFPIVLVDRTFLDGEFSVHAVIPVRISPHYVTILDPLRGERRVSLRKFESARRRAGRWIIQWSSNPSR